MGMFDQIRNDYKPLGVEFQGMLQTKDLDNMMDLYYLDPHGQLYLVDYAGTQDFAGTNTECKIPLINWISNGRHGRVMACTLTDSVVVYPEKWEGNWAEQPEACIEFVKGRVQDFYHGKHFQTGSTSRKAISFKKESGCCSIKKEQGNCDCGKS